MSSMRKRNPHIVVQQHEQDTDGHSFSSGNAAPSYADDDDDTPSRLTLREQLSLDSLNRQERKAVYARFKYSILLVLAFLVCLGVMKATGSVFSMLKTVPVLSYMLPDEAETMGEHALRFVHEFVFRTFFGASVFFVIAMVLSFPMLSRAGNVAKLVVYLYRKHFLIKALIFFAIVFACLTLVPTSVITSYASWSFTLSCAATMIYIIILIDFAYRWNEKWVSYDETAWYSAIVACAGLLLFGSIVLLVYVFVTYSGCNLGIMAACTTIFFALIYIALSLFMYHGSLLTACVVLAFCCYYCLSATLSVPNDDHCRAKTNIQFATVAGLIYTIFTYGSWLMVTVVGLVYSAVVTGGDAIRAFYIRLPRIGDESEDDDDETAYAKSLNRSYFFFHLYMILLCANIAMTLTLTGHDTSYVLPSGVAPIADPSRQVVQISHFIFDQGWKSFWFKMATQWVTVVMYIWTLLAPMLCGEDRSFDDD